MRSDAATQALSPRFFYDVYLFLFHYSGGRRCFGMGRDRRVSVSNESCPGTVERFSRVGGVTT